MTTSDTLTFNWLEGSNPQPDLWSKYGLGTDDEAYKPVRDLRRRRNARSTTGEINSIRGSTAHVFESTGEMRHTVILDADWRVERYQNQPKQLMLADGRSYTPDCKVWMRFGPPIYREIKPFKFLRDDPALDGKVQLIADAAAAEGCKFQIISSAWYDAFPRLRNAYWLRRAARRADQFNVELVAELLARQGPLPASEIARRSGIGEAGRFAAYGLAAIQRCRLSLDEVFDDDTMFEMVV